MCEIVELHREKSTTHVYSKCETLTCDNRSQQPPAHTPRARRVVGKGRLRKLLLVLVEHELEVLLYTSRHTRITHAHGHTGTATGTATHAHTLLASGVALMVADPGFQPAGHTCARIPRVEQA